MFCFRGIFIISCLLLWNPELLCGQRVFGSGMIEGHELCLPGISFDSASGDVWRIPLKKYGLAKSNYAVLVKVFVAGDSLPYHVPGLVQDRDSFGFILKVGNKRTSDTLLIVRRTGFKPVSISKITILAFRGKSSNGIIRYDRGFSKFLLARYLISSEKQKWPILIRSSGNYRLCFLQVESLFLPQIVDFSCD